MPTLQQRAAAIRNYVNSNYGTVLWSTLMDGTEAFALGELQGAYEGGQADYIPPIPGPAECSMTIVTPYGRLADPGETVPPNFSVEIAAFTKNAQGKIRLFDWDSEIGFSQEQTFTCVNGRATVSNFVGFTGYPIPPGHYKLRATFSNDRYGNWIELGS